MCESEQAAYDVAQAAYVATQAATASAQATLSVCQNLEAMAKTTRDNALAALNACLEGPGSGGM
jgi:hypothetical protein